MRILLDTDAFLWLVTDAPNLSAKAKALFLEAENQIFLSGVTGFETSVKYSLGKLQLTEPPRSFIENRINNNALTPLPIQLRHTYRLSHLPFHHRDPFDRLLVAQALEEDMPLLSADEILSEYGVERLW
jgi:PIN domain nuclease of toxin-antitoxin system